ncbi:DUF2948 family protein [Palleronia abyssalis]|uniref:DUF2948 domain-containing protein n=1 Tax=Palleronia abyssalis TaxID=1501240 RepID=A0A2R8C211_9RHOB|nr:DUF2948 family protein [Palleronia abyssalis]SPJ26420.1 hypothetical protein PAA8504_04279 [Palleronia abyssalis]
MSDNDARFQDARSGPLRLKALDPDDLQVVSSLCQDAVFPMSEMTWDRPQRRFGLLLNRLRREDPRVQGARDVERVRSVLVVEDVMSIRTQGIDRADKDTICALLSISLEPGEDGGGRLLFTLAGDGAIELTVEALEATLRDVTRPYIAPSGKLPGHDI